MNDDANRESWLEALMKRAVDEGELANLEGYGRPLASVDGAYDPDWWLKEKLKREKLTSLPAELELKRSVAAERAALLEVADEAEVRRRLSALNARIGEHNKFHVAGPTGNLAPVDLDDFLAAWRAQRQSSAT